MCLLILETPDPTKSMMKVVLSVRVGVSGVLCHLDLSNDITGHYDGYFGLNVGPIYPVLICFLDGQLMAYPFYRQRAFSTV